MKPPRVAAEPRAAKPRVRVSRRSRRLATALRAAQLVLLIYVHGIVFFITAK